MSLKLFSGTGMDAAVPQSDGSDTGKRSLRFVKIKNSISVLSLMTAQTALRHSSAACISPLDKPQHIMVKHLNEIEVFSNFSIIE